MELKKLVYMYLVQHAGDQPDLALLSVNSFQKDLSDPNQSVRALAVRPARPAVGWGPCARAHASCNTAPPARVLTCLAALASLRQLTPLFGPPPSALPTAARDGGDP
eukprot:5194667-Prymnesium_polylepis.1